MQLKPTIGLIDDHTSIRKGIRYLVESFGEFDVLFDVDNFIQLKTELENNRNLDILLMDIKMPDISGFELVKWMKTNYPLIKVLAFSSEEDGLSITTVIRNGAVGFVGKSENAAQVLQAIHTTLNGDSYLSQESLNKFSDVIKNSANYLTRTNIDLSDKEKEFMGWCCTALTYPEIAERMFISTRTVQDYRETLFKKMGVTTRQELVVYAMQNHIAKI